MHLQDSHLKFLIFLSKRWGTPHHIIDVSTPSSPFEVGYYSKPDWWVHSVYVSGSYAYLADGGVGLGIIDVSTPSAPYEIASCKTPGFAENVYAAGSYAYVADGCEGFRIIDISKLSSPFEVGYYNKLNWWVYSVYVSGLNAYLAEGGLRIINVSTPFTPSEVCYR